MKERFELIALAAGLVGASGLLLPAAFDYLPLWLAIPYALVHAVTVGVVLAGIHFMLTFDPASIEKHVNLKDEWF